MSLMCVYVFLFYFYFFIQKLLRRNALENTNRSLQRKEKMIASANFLCQPRLCVCEEQYCRLMLLQSFPQFVRIGLGDPAPFAVLSERDRRELLCTAGEDIAVAFLQIFVLPGFDSRKRWREEKTPRPQCKELLPARTDVRAHLLLPVPLSPASGVGAETSILFASFGTPSHSPFPPCKKMAHLHA